MSTEPESPFEGVAIVRLRPLYFVLMATILAGLLGFGWWRVHLLQEGARIAQELARLGPGTSAPPGGPGLGTILLLLLGLPLVLLPTLLAISRSSAMKRAVSGSVGVRDDHLTIDGKAVAPLGAISSALVIPADGDRLTVRLEGSGRRTVELRVRDDDQAAALLRALGLGPTQWAASYPLPFQSGDPRRYLGPALFFLGMFFNSVLGFFLLDWPGIGTFLAGLCWGIAGPITSALRPRLRVGTDGISIIQAKRTRFVPHEEIAGVAGRAGALEITLATGERIELSTSADQVEQIAERIVEAKDALASEVDPHPTLLSRSGTPRERIGALRALGQERKEGYRAAPVPTEQLWRIFESAANDAETRAGAAIALRERLDASSLRRLRIVAAATASPALRTAIESAASDDDESLEEALAALEHEAAEERAIQRVKAG